MLQITDLHATVADKPILKGLSLAINGGEIHAIMGPNGAGKSTLAYTLGGRPGYAVTGGGATLDGADLLAMAPHERAAAGLFLGFQYPVEIPGVSMVQFLREALNSQRKTQGLPPLSGAAFLKLAREQAALLKLDAEMLKRPVNVGFSGGEKKRAEMVQMGILDPKLAILDETDSAASTLTRCAVVRRGDQCHHAQARQGGAADYPLPAAARLCAARFRPRAGRRPHRQDSGGPGTGAANSKTQGYEAVVGMNGADAHRRARPRPIAIRRSRRHWPWCGRWQTRDAGRSRRARPPRRRSSLTGWRKQPRVHLVITDGMLGASVRRLAYPCAERRDRAWPRARSRVDVARLSAGANFDPGRRRKLLAVGRRVEIVTEVTSMTNLTPCQPPGRSVQVLAGPCHRHVPGQSVVSSARCQSAPTRGQSVRAMLLDRTATANAQARAGNLRRRRQMRARLRGGRTGCRRRCSTSPRRRIAAR